MRYGKKSLLLGMVFFSCSLVAPPPMFSETKEKMMAEQTVDMSSDELPCSMEAKIRKITVAELSEKVKDFNAGDPLLYSLLAILSGAEKDTCYYVEAKDLQKVFLHKSIFDISDSEVRDGKTFYKTRAPVDEMLWTSAKISEGTIKASSRLHKHFVKSVFGRKIIWIPKNLDFTIYTSSMKGLEEGDKKKIADEYLLFIAYENLEEPFCSEIFTLLTGLTCHEMPVKKNDRKPNRKEAYKALYYLNKKGLINIY